jgi:hypothetical protein
LRNIIRIPVQWKTRSQNKVWTNFRFVPGLTGFWIENFSGRCVKIINREAR